MNTISLSAISRKTGLTDREIKRQLLKSAKACCRYPLSEYDVYPIEIAGPGGIYTLRAAGKRSIHAILDYFDHLQERIDAGHEEQVHERIKDINRQIESLPKYGERAYQAREALGMAMMKTLYSESPKYP